MSYSNIKLIATDMDGTLLDSNHCLNELFIPTFKRLQEHGIIFSVASGRQLYNLQKQVAPVKEDIYFIAENGSFVMHQEEELFVQPIDKNTVWELVKIARQIPDSYLIICGKKQAYIENNSADFIEEVQLYFERFKVVDDLCAIENDEFLKFTVANLNGTEEFVYPFFKHLSQQLQVKISGKIWLDISHKQANKGCAIKVLQDKFGITKKETMVFGDFLNDLEMMGEASFSYSMKNAHPAVLEAANYTAKSNDENGVVEILQAVADELDAKRKEEAVV